MDSAFSEENATRVVVFEVHHSNGCKLMLPVLVELGTGNSPTNTS